MPYETLLVEIVGPTALIRLNRPEALNALNTFSLQRFHLPSAFQRF